MQRAPRRANPRRKHQRAVANDSPQSILQRLLQTRWGDAAVPEYTGRYRAVPGRRFRVDVGFPHVRLAVESAMAGNTMASIWTVQSRSRAGNRLLLLSGWRVLRFYASEITTARKR